MRRLTYFVFGSYIVGALVAFAPVVASSYLAAPNHAISISRLPVQAALLDIIRCSPPTQPDAWLHRTSMADRSAAQELRLGSLLHRTDIFDPNDCGRVITQAMSSAVAPANRAHIG
jgi:hypothetical protein